MRHTLLNIAIAVFLSSTPALATAEPPTKAAIQAVLVERTPGGFGKAPEQHVLCQPRITLLPQQRACVRCGSDTYQPFAWYANRYYLVGTGLNFYMTNLERKRCTIEITAEVSKRSELPMNFVRTSTSFNSWKLDVKLGEKLKLQCETDSDGRQRWIELTILEIK